MSRNAEQLVEQIGALVRAVASDTSVPEVELRQVLRFLTKVCQVVDQAFEDVLGLLTELQFLTDADVRSGRAATLETELEMLLARSRYRDAEEICSRLSHLRTQFDEQIRPILQGVSDTDRWRELLYLIEDREGDIIELVRQSVWEVRSQLRDHARLDVAAVARTAQAQATGLRASLAELRALTNAILGISGRPGLLELTRDRGALSQEVRVSFPLGTTGFRQDTYITGQAGAVGPGASAAGTSFAASWNQVGSAINLRQAAVELRALRDALRSGESSADHDEAIGAVASAEKAALAGDGPGMLEHLKRAGKWALDCATSIGTRVAAAAIKSAVGL
jgi:hypothetical protein